VGQSGAATSKTTARAIGEQRFADLAVECHVVRKGI
jgi:hypothetical protein